MQSLFQEIQIKAQWRSNILVMFLCGVALCVAGCVAQSSDDNAMVYCEDYTEAIEPLLQSSCGECHPGEGYFSVNSYRDVMATSPTGERWVWAGNAESTLLVYAAGIDDHPAAAQSDLESLNTWVVDCEASFRHDGRAHPQGFASPTSDNFHGHTMFEQRWDSLPCLECHGQPQSNITCATCHSDAEGTGSCTTCHGNSLSAAPPRATTYSQSPFAVGAHNVHVFGGPLLNKPLPCETCHIVPSQWLAANHLFDDNAELDLDGRAEVLFSELASQASRTDSARVASYDPATGECTVYCHGVGGSYPSWGQDSADITCAICHGEPPMDGLHPQTLTRQQCVGCHPRVIDSDGDFIDASLHIDGKVSLGDDSQTCGACHGSTSTGAPPPDLMGSYDTTGPVGAHIAHLEADAFRGPIGCDECHPSYGAGDFIEGVRSPGHIDPDNPGVVFGTLATADGATPTYTENTRSCANSYCHGGGTYLSGDATLGIKSEVFWDPALTGGVYCGSCHGLPPTVGVGHSTATLATCVNCHGSVVNAGAAIIFDDNGMSRHINGVVDYN